MSDAHLKTGPRTIHVKLPAAQPRLLALVLVAVFLLPGTPPGLAAPAANISAGDAKSLGPALKPATSPDNASNPHQNPAGRIVLLNSRAIDLTTLPETAFGDRD